VQGSVFSPMTSEQYSDHSLSKQESAL